MGQRVLKTVDPLKRTDKITQKPFSVTIKEADGTITTLEIGVKICLDVKKDFYFTGKHPDSVDVEIHQGYGMPDIKDRKINAQYLVCVDVEPSNTFAFEVADTGDTKEIKEIKDVNKVLAVRTGWEWVSLLLSEAGVYETYETDGKSPRKEVPRTQNLKPVVSHYFKKQTYDIDGFPFVELATYEIPKDMDQAQANEGVEALKKEVKSGKTGIEDEHGDRGEEHPWEPPREHHDDKPHNDHIKREGRGKGP
jgi:hypothetical protein